MIIFGERRVTKRSVTSGTDKQKDFALGQKDFVVSLDTNRYVKDLYTPEQKYRRDTTIWTPVQGVLAALQFIVFAISLILVLYFMVTGEGKMFAESSILVKTGFLYTIMITGAIWEKVVFGQYLFAPAFFWEDVFSFAVIASHTAYLIMLFGNYGSANEQMILILIGYGLYVINAGQFIIKLKKARKQAVDQTLSPQAEAPLCYSDISSYPKTTEGRA